MIIAATADDSGSGVFVIEVNHILGRNIIQSSLVGNGTVILVDFFYLMIEMFGATDLIVNPFSSAGSEIMKITTHSFADLAVRQPEVFYKIDLSQLSWSLWAVCSVRPLLGLAISSRAWTHRT